METNKPNGLAAATLLAGGFGAFFMGLITLLSEVVASVGPALNWITPVGPLSGKTITATVVWLIVWAILGFAWKGKDKDFGKMSMIAMVLLLLGILGTFPFFWKLFGA